MEIFVALLFAEGSPLESDRNELSDCVFLIQYEMSNGNECMDRRSFIKNIACAAVGGVLGQMTGGLRSAEAAWASSGAEDIPIKETYLKFGPLENRRRTDAIVIHHIGNTNRDVTAAEVHQWHIGNGWSGIGYHYLVRKDGTIERGRPLGTVGGHCYGENSHTVGINIVGDFEANYPTSAQMESAGRLVASICRVYGLLPGNSVFGHRDFGGTVCPGRILYGMLPEIVQKAEECFGAVAKNSSPKEETGKKGSRTVVRKDPRKRKIK